MTRARLAIVVLACWLVVLGILLQPHSHRPPHIGHSQPLEPPDRSLPTLGPSAP